jgi:hypothetical protein
MGIEFLGISLYLGQHLSSTGLWFGISTWQMEYQQLKIICWQWRWTCLDSPPSQPVMIQQMGRSLAIILVEKFWVPWKFQGQVGSAQPCIRLGSEVE